MRQTLNQIEEEEFKKNEQLGDIQTRVQGLAARKKNLEALIVGGEGCRPEEAGGPTVIKQRRDEAEKSAKESENRLQVE